MEILTCSLGRFQAGAARILPALITDEKIREALACRLSIYDVGLFMNEDRDLVVVMRSQPLGSEGRSLVQGALERLFLEHAARLGDGEDFPRFRWLNLSEESLPEKLGVPGKAAIRH